jgi:NAD(P)-dependent dehydrogenase (short-subunit alcohol dehydrogenase family)
MTIDHNVDEPSAENKWTAHLARYPSLASKVVLVTGGGSGIGAVLVEAFVANGSKVAFFDILDDPSRDLARRCAELGPEPLYLRCDLTDITAPRASIADVHNRLGLISVLVNNAANDQREPIDDVTPDSWDRAQGINLKYLFFAAQAVRPHMRELGGGSIINFSSTAWMVGAASLTAYATAKFGIVGLTYNLARELGVDNIRVNAIAPGAVVTERQRQLWLTEADIQAFRDRQCLHRSLEARDIAGAVLFLASDDAAMITKQCLLVDGGLR